MMERDAFSDNTASQLPPRRWSFGLLGVAVVSSLLASTCCVIPLLLVLLGVTGAWMASLTALRPWEPLFVTVALVALGWAGYLMFKPATQCSTNADACGEVPRQITRRIYVACALFVGGLLAFPLVAPIFY